MAIRFARPVPLDQLGEALSESCRSRLVRPPEDIYGNRVFVFDQSEGETVAVLNEGFILITTDADPTEVIPSIASGVLVNEQIEPTGFTVTIAGVLRKDGDDLSQTAYALKQPYGALINGIRKVTSVLIEAVGTRIFLRHEEIPYTLDFNPYYTNEGGVHLRLKVQRAAPVTPKVLNEALATDWAYFAEAQKMPELLFPALGVKKQGR